MNTNALIYNDTSRTLSLLSNGLYRFNKQFTRYNKLEVEGYLEELNMVSLEFEIHYSGPELLKLELLGKIQEAKDEAVIAIIEFNQLSSI